MRERNTVTAIFEDALSAGAAWDVLHKLTHAFQWVADDAMNIANGGRAKLDLTPDGELARLERRAGEYDKADPFFPKGVSNPCKSLAKMRELLTLLDAAAAEGEREGYPDEAKEALRVEALRVVANSSLLRDMVRIRGEAIFEREGLAMAAVGELARAAARAAEAEARAADIEATLHRKQGEVKEARAAEARATAARANAEAARAAAEEAAAVAKAKAEVYKQMMMGEFAEIKSGVQKATAEAEAAKQAAAGAHAAATRGRLAAEGARAAAEEGAAAAQDAERASLRAEAAAKGKAEVGALARDYVETFKAFDAALKDEAGAQLEIAAGVIAEAKEEGRLIGNGNNALFLRYWRGWIKRGRPDAGQYRVIYEREGRWPE